MERKEGSEEGEGDMWLREWTNPR